MVMMEMTERFTVGEQLRVVDDNIVKGQFYVCSDRAEAWKVADKLNEFHNENVRLNNENERLKQVIADNEKLIHSVYDELTKLRCIKRNLSRIKNQWDLIMEAVQHD